MRTRTIFPVLLFSALLSIFSDQYCSAQVKVYTPEELKNLDVGVTCITSECHTDLKKERFLHGPTAKAECAPCHEAVGGKHVFTSVAEGNKLCFECHDPIPPGKVEHEPVQKNCLECHAVHGANNRFFLLESEDVKLCDRCHDKDRKDNAFKHGPYDRGLCLACHTPHNSDNDHLLVEPPEQFCFMCHEEMADNSKGAISVHEPYVKDCNGCHSAHGSNQRYFLHAEASELCNQCHEDDMTKWKQAKVPHKPLVEDAKCSGCHEPHFSNNEKLLQQASGPLCLSCHDQTYTQENGKTLVDVKAQIEGAKFLHGPVKDGTCVPCHNAHGSDYAKLLNRYFPPRFYAPFKEENYELCFFCHDKNVTLEPESIDTKFRNGNQNMHYLHVNREKGRTCRACHAEHASDNPVHIRPAVPYGRWMMENDFVKTETGGTCATGCHQRYGYDRENPVKNPTQGQ